MNSTELKSLFYQTHHFWNRDGKKRSTYSEFKRWEIELKNSYGITNLSTLGFKVAYDGIQEYLDGNGYGITDLELNWNHCFIHKVNQLIGTKIIAIVPIKSNYQPGIRYGRFGLEFSFALNQVFQLNQHFIFLYGDLGYRWYQGFPSDQGRTKIGFFYPFNSKISIQFENEFFLGLFNGKSRLDQSHVWMNPNFQLWKGELFGNFRINKRTLIGIGYFQYLAGKNVGTSGGITTKLNFVF